MKGPWDWRADSKLFDQGELLSRPIMDVTREVLTAKYQWLERTLRQLVDSGIKLEEIRIVEKYGEYRTTVFVGERQVASCEIKFNVGERSKGL